MKHGTISQPPAGVSGGVAKSPDELSLACGRSDTRRRCSCFQNRFTEVPSPRNDGTSANRHSIMGDGSAHLQPCRCFFTIAHLRCRSHPCRTSVALTAHCCRNAARSQVGRMQSPPGMRFLGASSRERSGWIPQYAPARSSCQPPYGLRPGACARRLARGWPALSALQPDPCESGYLPICSASGPPIDLLRGGGLRPRGIRHSASPHRTHRRRMVQARSGGSQSPGAVARCLRRTPLAQA